MTALDTMLAQEKEPMNPLWFGKVPEGKIVERKFEQPWQKMALHLLAQGESKITVAGLVGKTPAAISQLCKTEWFQVLLEQEIRTRMGTGLVEQFQADCAMARAVENELLANPLVKAEVRAGIAARKIERVYGKAKQLVQFDNVTQSQNPVAEAEELERSIARDVAALGLPTPSGNS